MLTRRQMLTSSLGLTAGFFLSDIATGFNYQHKISQDLLAPVSENKSSSFEILRDMLIHQVVGHPPPPGHWVAGHGWLYRKGLAKKFIARHYTKHQSLPCGKHDLASIPSYQSPWIVDFDKHLRTIEIDIARGNLTDYPQWTGVDMIGGRS